jgi:predicted PurR-regulated permease PerM
MDKQQHRLAPSEIKGLIAFGVLFTAAVYLAIRFIDAIAEVLVLFSLVFLFTIILSPIVTFLERHKVPRYVAAVLMAFLLICVVGVLIRAVYPILAAQFVDLFNSLPHYIDATENWLASHAGYLGFKPVGQGQIGFTGLSQSVQPILKRVGSYTVSAIGVLASVGIVFISTIYALASPRPILENMLRLFGPGRAERAADILQELSVQMRRWAYSVLAGMAAIFLLPWVALALILHLPFALLFAAIAGVLEIIPTIGPILSAIPPLLVAISIDPTLALWVIVAFIIIQQIENHIIVPLILGSGVQLHPVSVIFSVTVMAILFGVVGIFLAVPVAVVVKILVTELYIKPLDREQHELHSKVEPIVSGQDNQS